MGRLELHFVIGGDGRVSNLALRQGGADLLLEANVASCVLDEICSWRFPAPAGGGTVVVTYPLILGDPEELE